MIAALADCLVVVTGLPRSGTSLVMAMLQAGGMSLLVDADRPADADNPGGYFEYTPVKRLATDASWVAALRGCAIKVVIPLIRHLPPTMPVRMIWVQRAIDEVLASQAAMLARRGVAGSSAPSLLRTAMLRMEQEALSQLQNASATAWLPLSHRRLVTEPRAAAQEIQDFLDPSLSVDAMAACVQPGLYRQRLA